MEVNVRNVQVDIIYHQLQHVQYAQVKQIVPLVLELQMHVLHAKLIIIQMEPVALLAQRFIQNVSHVLKQQRHVRNVQQDII